MDYTAIFIIAVALAMDAFSVSLSAGMVIPRPGPRHYFRLAFHFGLFQGMMPVIGYSGGRYFASLIQDYDHWIAFGLLVFIGGRMIYEAFTSDDEKKLKDPSRGRSLVVLSVATSIDALAVGITIGVLGDPIIMPSIIIAVVCSLFSIGGIYMGHKIGRFFGEKAGILGGLMLIGIGVKILVEHTMG